MDIDAVAYFKYDLGSALSGESLDLVIKFRSGKGIFRKKLTLVTVSSNDYKSMDDYYEKVEQVLSDRNFAIKEAEEIIRNWIKKNEKRTNLSNKQDEIFKRVNKMGKIHFRVKV